MTTFYENYWNEKKSDELDDFKYKWPIVRKLITSLSGLTFLDYGCGSGKLLSEVSRICPKNNYLGVDVSESGIKRAKKRFPKAKYLLTQDGEKLKIKNDSIDFILAADVIEHVYDVNTLLDEFYRILKPGGKILITTPFHGLIKNLIIVIVGFDKVFDPTGPHIRFFTKKSLAKLLISRKFNVIETGFFGRFYPIYRGMYFLAKK